MATRSSLTLVPIVLKVAMISVSEIGRKKSPGVVAQFCRRGRGRIAAGMGDQFFAECEFHHIGREAFVVKSSGSSLLAPAAHTPIHPRPGPFVRPVRGSALAYSDHIKSRTGVVESGTGVVAGLVPVTPNFKDGAKIIEV
jgi:hypothetical protein